MVLKTPLVSLCLPQNGLTLQHRPLHVILQVRIEHIQVERVDFPPKFITDFLRKSNETDVFPRNAERCQEFHVEEELQRLVLVEVAPQQPSVLAEDQFDVSLNELNMDLLGEGVRQDVAYVIVEFVEKVVQEQAGF